MAEIKTTVKLGPIYNMRARLPRKLKKKIVKVAGSAAYRELIYKMSSFYNLFGYRKFNIKEAQQ